jgi:mutual gliding-motility protein MglA
MVSINYSSREVCCKIVYYGPGLSGKTTNLQYVHAKVPQNSRGKLISLATEADRTLYFDFLPINIGSINGFSAKFQLYTVPGQVYYNATRKLVLRGVDGIVFVADSQPDKMDENIESLLNLEENLSEYGYAIDDVPIVIQYNKRDLPGVLTVEQLDAQLNKRGWPHFEASATVGNGVFDTLKLVIKLVLDKAKNTSSVRMRPSTGDSGRVPTVSSSDSGRIPTFGSSDSGRIPLNIVGADSGRVPMPSGDSGRIPIAARAQDEPIDSVGPDTGRIHVEGTRTATAPYEQPAYRPYPGTDHSAAAVQRPAPAAPVVSAPAVEPRPTAMTPSYESVTAERRAEELSNQRTPAMAPPLRRRPEAKKRGFFKRLFGLK